VLVFKKLGGSSGDYGVCEMYLNERSADRRLIIRISTRKTTIFVGFEVLTAVSTKMAVFLVVAQCSLVEAYQRFRCPCCLHHQGDHSLP
jgi:hypothetical protein